MQLKAKGREMFHCFCFENNQNKAYKFKSGGFFWDHNSVSSVKLEQRKSRQTFPVSHVMKKSNSCPMTFALGQPGLKYLASQINSLFLQEAESKPLLKHLQTNTMSSLGYSAFTSGKISKSSTRHSDSKKLWLRHSLTLFLLERVRGWDSSFSFVGSGSPLRLQDLSPCNSAFCLLSESSGSFISSCLFIP